MQDRRKLDVAITEVYVPVVLGRASVILCLALACATATPEPVSAPPIPKECPELPVSQYPQKEASLRDLAIAHRSYALQRSELGDVPGSVAHYRCALALAPDLPDTRIELAAQLVTAAAFADAHAELIKIHDQVEPDFRSRTLMASALEGMGQLREAADELARAADETKSSAVLYRRAAELYARAGDASMAGELKAKADELDPPQEQRQMRPLVPAKPPPNSKEKKKKKNR